MIPVYWTLELALTRRSKPVVYDFLKNFLAERLVTFLKIKIVVKKT